MNPTILALTLSLALPVLCGAAVSSPEALWKAGPAVEPLLQKGRPWALLEEPEGARLAKTAENLLSRMARLESSLSVFAQTAAELETALASKAPERRRTVEDLLSFLAYALPAQASDSAQASAALAVLADAKGARRLASAPALTRRAEAVEAQTLRLLRRLEQTRGNLSPDLGPRAAWLAERLADTCADLAWQAQRLKELARDLAVPVRP